MKKYKVTYQGDVNSTPMEVGCYGKKEKAINEAFKFFHEHNLRADVDSEKEIKESLKERGFFLSAYAPRELVVEEIDT